jgi:hypothetical protein
MQFGGVCYWGIEVKKSRYAKEKRLGEGNDLRDAIDDAMENERAALTPETPETE